MRSTTVLATLSLTVVAVGCRTSHAGFDGTGFRHRVVPYGVRYAEGTERVMPAPWYPRNFEQVSESARPGAQKTDGTHWSSIWVDLDDDGETEALPGTTTWDLDLLHPESDARVLMRIRPVAPALRKLSMKAMVRRFVDQLARERAQVIVVHRSAQILKNLSAPIYATRVVREGERTIDGQPAYEAIVDVAPRQNLAFDQENVQERVRVVMVATPYTDWTRHFDTSLSNKNRRRARHRDDCGMLLTAIFYARPMDFERHDGEFEDVLSRLYIEAPGKPPREGAPEADGETQVTAMADSGGEGESHHR